MFRFAAIFEHAGRGVIPTLAPYLLPELGPLLAEAFPALRVTWIEEKTDVLVRRVENGELEVVPLAEEADSGHLELMPIVRDEFVLSAPRECPLGGTKAEIGISADRARLLAVAEEQARD